MIETRWFISSLILKILCIELVTITIKKILLDIFPFDSFFIYYT